MNTNYDKAIERAKKISEQLGRTLEEDQVFATVLVGILIEDQLKQISSEFGEITKVLYEIRGS